ncbi:MAG: phytanoyl-CoA dioxygenase family protein [Geminicoccaceae bacterium]
MATNRKPVTIGDEDALSWAQSHFSSTSSDLLRDSPWARTYRLSSETGSAYLKILPEHQRPIVRSTALIAEHFPRHAPEVIASDEEHGWILAADHGGRMLSYDSDEKDQCKLLKTYARFQVEAFKLPDLLVSLRKPDLASLLPSFIDFLGREADVAAGPVGVRYFVGRSDAKRYFRAFSRRRALLERHLEPAALLPVTLCHGDLRPPNVAIRPDGACVLCDWDDAVAGPAGFSLHAMFSGCFKPTILLTEGGEAARAVAGEQRARCLQDYIAVLVTGGYADEAMLRRALPASICAGVLQYLLNFASYPSESRSHRKAVERSIKRRLSDLLDLCDHLAARERLTALQFAKDYAKTRQYRRAQYLLQDYLADHPDDVDAQAMLARVLKARGKVDEALATFRHTLDLAPDRAITHNDLGRLHLERLEIEEASARFQRAIEIDPNLTAARDNLERATALEQMRVRAGESGVVPTVAFSPEEAAEGLLRPENLALASSLFKTYGVIQVENAFPVDMIQRLQDAFFARYTSYFRKDDHPDALRVGDQRYMLTVDLDDPFDDPRLYASPLILPIFRELLGDDCVIGAFTSVISLPGSKDQRLHKDHPALFPSTKWHHRLPSFAIQMIVPLVSLDEVVGTTRVYKGSHTVPTERAAKEMESQDPVVPLGSCLINDYRVCHRGLGNRSDKVRPILTIIYNRPWFRDYANYSRQPPLRITDSQYEQVPRENQKLFDWWRQERHT